jgi:hypothetical protein
MFFFLYWYQRNENAIIKRQHYHKISRASTDTADTSSVSVITTFTNGVILQLFICDTMYYLSLQSKEHEGLPQELAMNCSL